MAITGKDWESVDIYLTSADGSRAMLLTKNAKIGDRNGYDALPDWSPDGTSLAIVSSLDGPNSIYVLSNLEPYLERLATPYRMVTFDVDPVEK